ncbi:MAG: dipeptidase [Chloroflexi bacterium]|nr:dipeptidase [Chloroflexota bacterium]
MTRIFTDADAQVTQRIGIADLHSDLPLGLLKRRFDGQDGSLRTEWLPRLRAGGVRVVVCAIYIDSNFLPEGALRRAVQLIDALLEEIAACRDAIELALSEADVERITGDGKIAAILALEGAEPLGHDLAALRLFYRLGMRMLSFAWMRRTAFGDGAWENDSRGGLTRLGQDAVREMNRLGIIIDVSHASDQTTWDILETSSRPVIASHSNARALQVHPRNLTDEMIAAIAASGGLIGVVAVARYISDTEPTVARWADHVDHIVELAGIDHVGIGCDFYDDIMTMGASQEIPAWNPGGGLGQLSFAGMRTWEDLPGLTAALLRRGYTEADLRKVYRENVSRVMGDVQGA